MLTVCACVLFHYPMFVACALFSPNRCALWRNNSYNSITNIIITLPLQSTLMSDCCLYYFSFTVIINKAKKSQKVDFQDMGFQSMRASFYTISLKNWGNRYNHGNNTFPKPAPEGNQGDAPCETHLAPKIPVTQQQN